MGTAVTDKSIVLTIPPTLLGPESDYAKRCIEIKQDHDKLLLDAKKITKIETPEDLTNANNCGRVLQAAGKEVELFYVPLKRQVDAFKRPLLDDEREFSTALDTEKKRVAGLIMAYNQEQERQRQQAEREAREAAEKAARNEQLDRAIEMEAAGESEAAVDAVLDEQVFSPAVIQQSAPPKMAGQVATKRWKVKITDTKAIYRAIADGKLSMECAPISEGWLNRKANMDKQGFCVPGCIAEPDDGLHFRA